MALTERLQLLVESIGGSAVVSDFTKIGNAGKTEFERAAAAGNKAASDVESAQKRMAAATEAGQAKILAANQRLEGAQLKAAQSASAVDRAQAKVGESAVGTDAAAKAAERLEAAQLRAAHASETLEASQAKAASVSARANAGIAEAEQKLRGAERAASSLAASSDAAGRSLAQVGTGGGLTATLDKLTSFGVNIPPQLLAVAQASQDAGQAAAEGADGLTTLANAGTATQGALAVADTKASALGSSLKGGLQAGALVAGAALVKMTVDGLAKIEKLDGEIRKLKGSMGATAEEASKMRNVAAGLGIDTDALAGGMVKLSRNLDSSKDGFAGVDVAVARNADGTANMAGTIDNLRSAYQSIQDPIQRNIFLTEAMGKGGAELRAVLSANNAEYQKMANSGPIRSDQDLKDSRDLAIAQRELGKSFEELQVGMASGLVPTLAAVANGLAWVTDKLAITAKAGGGLGGLIGSAIGAVIPGIGILQALGAGHDDAAAAAYDHEQAEAKLTGQLELEAAAAEKVAQGRSTLVDLQMSALDRTTATSAAEESLAAAELRLSDVRISSAQQAARAKEDYAAKVTSANEKVGEAEAKLATAQEDAAARVVAAQKSATEANQSAHQSTRDAERALSDLRKSQSAAGNPALAAQLSKAQATQRAVEAVDKARAREGDVAQKGSESVDRARAEGGSSVASATKDLSAARAEQNKVAAEGSQLAELAKRQQREIADAVKGVGKAQAELAAARRTDAVAAAKHEAARIEAALAIQGITLTATQKNELLAQQYDAQAAKLSPDSPLRKNLREFADGLRGLVMDVDTAPFMKSIDAATASLAKLKPVEGGYGPMPANVPGQVTIGGTIGSGVVGRSGRARARGGLVDPGVTYTVGEEGSETLVMYPAGGGYVIPHGGGRAGGGPVGVGAQFSAAMHAGAGGSAIDYDRLAATMVRALLAAGVGEGAIGPFIFHGVQPGDLPSQLPREMRKQRYLAGNGR